MKNDDRESRKPQTRVRSKGLHDEAIDVIRKYVAAGFHVTEVCANQEPVEVTPETNELGRVWKKYRPGDQIDIHVELKRERTATARQPVTLELLGPRATLPKTTPQGEASDTIGKLLEQLEKANAAASDLGQALLRACMHIEAHEGCPLEALNEETLVRAGFRKDGRCSCSLICGSVSDCAVGCWRKYFLGDDN